MSLVRKNLALDAARLRELAERRGESESAVVREAVTNALFAEELVDLLRQLHEAGYAVIEPDGSDSTGSPADSDPS
jgi:hypothetical protein